MPRIKISKLAAALVSTWLCCPGVTSAAGGPGPRAIGELKTAAVIHVGKTADWVAITTDAVWVGSTGPYAVHRIDPGTNRRVATVKLPGEPCAGLAIGFGSLWVPLCGRTQRLAKVDLRANTLRRVFDIGAAAAEGGIAASPDSLWLVVDRVGSLARIDPATGAIRQSIHVPDGSYNPLYSAGKIWITRAEGAEVTSVDAGTGTLTGSAATAPGPRFLTAGAGAVWTLNQGDGSLTRIDASTGQATSTVALGTPGSGGDIAFGSGMVWSTVAKMPLTLVDAATATVLCQWAGPGGDSLGIGHDSLWLTNYHAGTLSRIALSEVLARCNHAPVR